MVFGRTGTDPETGINYDRMKKYRLERTREMMNKYGVGVLITWDECNQRYIAGGGGHNEENQEQEAHIDERCHRGMRFVKLRRSVLRHQSLSLHVQPNNGHHVCFIRSFCTWGGVFGVQNSGL